MKTYVRTKLGWSKLVLVTAVLAVVAMLSVIGLCFTNANADNAGTQENAGVEFNIPVNNLFYPYADAIFCAKSEWVKNPDPELPSYFSKETKPGIVIDDTVLWNDNQGNSVAKLEQPNLFTVKFYSETEKGELWKKWGFKVDGPFSWYMTEDKNDGKGPQVIKFTAETVKNLNSNFTYSFYYGQPELYKISSLTDEIKDFSSVIVPHWGGEEYPFSDSLPYSFDVLCQPKEASAYYIPDGEHRLVLNFVSPGNQICTYNFMIKNKSEAKYIWKWNNQELSTDVEHPTPIVVGKNIVNELTIDKAPAPEPITDFTVKGQVVDTDGNPIANASVGFYNSDVDPELEDPLVSTLTDVDGNFVLKGCYTGTNPEILKITYTAKHYDLLEARLSYKKAKTGEVEFDEPLVLQDAVLDLYSDSPQHKSFTVTAYRQEKGKDQPELLFCRTVEYFGKAMDENSNEENYIFDISDNGVLTNVDTDDFGITKTTVVPNAADGYKFDNYLVNDKTAYKVGESVDIMQPITDEGHARVAVNYTAADGGNITQTGDSGVYAAIALAALVMAAGAVYILRRKNESC